MTATTDADVWVRIWPSAMRLPVRPPAAGMVIHSIARPSTVCLSSSSRAVICGAAKQFGDFAGVDFAEFNGAAARVGVEAVVQRDVALAVAAHDHANVVAALGGELVAHAHAGQRSLEDLHGNSYLVPSSVSPLRRGRAR